MVCWPRACFGDGRSGRYGTFRHCIGTEPQSAFSTVVRHLGFCIGRGCRTRLLIYPFIVYCPIDRVFDKQHQTARYTLQQPTTVSSQKEGGDDGFRFNDFVKVLRTPGFWLVAFVCVFFYSSIRPFMKFATDLLVNSFNVNDETAGWIVAAIPYGTILLTPAFGAINDRHNNGPILMTIGCAIVSASHLLLAFPLSHSAWYALAIMVFEGIAFSLVPSALWPQVPKIVPLKQLGTAYSIIYYIQNIGLMIVPVIAGHVIDAHTATNGHIDYTMPMLFFAVFGIAALGVSYALIIKTKNKGTPVPTVQALIAEVTQMVATKVEAV